MIVTTMCLFCAGCIPNHLYEVAVHLDCLTIVILLQKYRPRANILERCSKITARNLLVHEHFNRDFTKKNISSAPEFKTATFHLMPSRLPNSYLPLLMVMFMNEEALLIITTAS